MYALVFQVSYFLYTYPAEKSHMAMENPRWFSVHSVWGFTRHVWLPEGKCSRNNDSMFNQPQICPLSGNPATENGRASAHSDADTDRNSDLAMSSLTWKRGGTIRKDQSLVWWKMMIIIWDLGPEKPSNQNGFVLGHPQKSKKYRHLCCHSHRIVILYGGWWFFATPLKNDGVRQLGSCSSQLNGKSSNSLVPNHQPVDISIRTIWGFLKSWGYPQTNMDQSSIETQ